MFVLQNLSSYLFSRNESIDDYYDFNRYKKYVKLNDINIGFEYMCFQGICDNSLYITLHINHRLYRYCSDPHSENVSYEVGFNKDLDHIWFYEIIYRPNGWRQGSHIEFQIPIGKNKHRKYVFKCPKNITLPVIGKLCPYTQGTMLLVYNTKYKNYSKKYKPDIYDIDALLYDGVVQTI
jgi:hypothetical protein